jgi:hypothetical protein
MRTRRGDAEVKRTKPGSTLDFRLEYDNSKKWTDDDPRDGIGPDGELEAIFDELDVKRMIKKLEKAVKSYLDGNKGAEDELRARGKEMDRVLGEDRALTVVRHLKGSVDDKKVKKALEIAKDVIGGKKAMDRFEKIAGKIAAEVPEWDGDAVNGVLKEIDRLGRELSRGPGSKDRNNRKAVKLLQEAYGIIQQADEVVLSGEW